MSNEQILALYKKCTSVKRIHILLHGTMSYNKIRDIIRESGLLATRGNPNMRNKPLVRDPYRDFRYLTDKDLNFEEEIRTKYE